MLLWTCLLWTHLLWTCLLLRILTHLLLIQHHTLVKKEIKRYAEPPPRGVTTVEARSLSIGEEIANETVTRHGSVSENQLSGLRETVRRQQNARSGDKGVSPPVAHDSRREVGNPRHNGGE